MPNVNLKLVMGKDPHSEIYGFSLKDKNDYGAVIPDKVDKVLFNNVDFVSVDGTFEFGMASNVFGASLLVTFPRRPSLGEHTLMWDETNRRYRVTSPALIGFGGYTKDRVVYLSLSDG